MDTTTTTTTTSAASAGVWVADLLEGVHSLLDDLPQGPVTGDLPRLLVDTERAIQRLHALKLKIVAAAETTHIATNTGHTDTSAWLAQHTRTTGPTAAREVKLARNLQQHPTLQTALTNGTLSTEHATIITHTHHHLPPTLTPTQRTQVEQKLLDLAHTHDPATLRRKARRVLHHITTQEQADRHHDQLLRDEEEHARTKTRLTLHNNHDGTTTGHFTIPTHAADILTKITQQLTAPRRNHHTPHTNDWAHHTGLAFTELIEHLPTDRLHHKVAATIIITIDHQQLHHNLAAAHLDTGTEISPSQARRLACNAGILPAILNTQSQPLDLGRTQRLFTHTQRTALATQHTTCNAEGCQRPYAWCELHHTQPWTQNGPTNLTNAQPLCHHHHQLIHNPNYTHHQTPNGKTKFHKRN